MALWTANGLTAYLPTNPQSLGQHFVLPTYPRQRRPFKSTKEAVKLQKIPHGAWGKIFAKVGTFLLQKTPRQVHETHPYAFVLVPFLHTAAL
jgi:hypothetical protein